MTTTALIKTEQMKDCENYRWSTCMFKLFLLSWHRLGVRGVENIPDDGGVMIASNHASYLDPPVVASGYRKRPIHFMARNTLWKPGFGKWWMDSVGCIPVARGTGDRRALTVTIKMLKEGKVVSMFPEGTRSEDGELQKAKGGVAFIIEKSKCVVVPAYIDGSYRAYAKGTKFIKPLKVTITYGKPITQEDFQALGSGRAAYDAHAALIMERIAELKNKA
ncbi:MAG: lysophospholipid acyltransferase family protein [Pontiella sp.]